MNWDEDGLELNKEELLKLGQRTLARQQQKRTQTPTSTPSKGLISSLEGFDDFGFPPNTPQKIPLQYNSPMSHTAPSHSINAPTNSFPSTPITAKYPSAPDFSPQPIPPTHRTTPFPSESVIVKESSRGQASEKALADLKEELLREQNLANELEQQNSENLKAIVLLRQEGKRKEEMLAQSQQKEALLQKREGELLKTIEDLKQSMNSRDLTALNTSEPSEIIELRARCSELEQEYQRMQAQLSQAENPRLEESSHLQEINDLKQLNASLLLENKKLTEQWRYDTQSRQVQIDTLSSEVQKKSLETEKLAKEMRKLLNENEMFQHKVSALEKQVSEKNHQLMQQVMSSDAVMGDFHEMTNEVKTLKLVLTEKTNDINRLGFLIETLQGEKSDLETAVSSLQLDLEKAQKHQTQMISHEGNLIASLQAQLSDALQRADEQTLTIQALEMEKNEVAALHIQTQEQLNSLQFDFEDFKKSQDLHTAKLTNLYNTSQAEVRELKVLHNVEKSEGARLFAENEALTNEISQTKTELEKLRIQSTHELNDKRAEINSLMKQFEDLKLNSEQDKNGNALQFAARLSELEKAKLALEQELESKTSKLATLELTQTSTIQKQKLEKDTLLSQNSDLAAQLNFYIEENKRLKETRIALPSPQIVLNQTSASASTENETDVPEYKLKERIAFLEAQLIASAQQIENLSFLSNQNTLERYRTTAELLGREKEDLTAQVESQTRLIEKMLEEREDSLELHNIVTAQSLQIQNFGKEKQEIQKLLFNKTVELDEKSKALESLQLRFDAWSQMNSIDSLQSQEKTISQLQTVISELRRQLASYQDEEELDPPTPMKPIDTLYRSPVASGEPGQSSFFTPVKPLQTQSSFMTPTPVTPQTQTSTPQPQSSTSKPSWFWTRLGYQ